MKCNMEYLKISNILRLVMIMNLALISTSLQVNSLTAVIRKGKFKEVEKLKKDIELLGENHLINKFLSTKVTDELHVGFPMNFFNSTMNRFNTLSVMPEYNKKIKTGFILGMPEPTILGGVLREAGARAIAVDMDSRSGGVTRDEFRLFVRDQYRSRKLDPGAIPVVWSDFIVDKLQIAEAASLGAAAITLSPDITDELPALINYSKELNVEPIIIIKNEEDADLAFSNGARCVCMKNMDESELVELRKKLPDNPSYMYIAKLRAIGDFSTYSEIDTAWLIRDSGFNCVWPSPEAVYAIGLSDVYSTVMAMKAKASREYLSPRQFMMDRKKEGAVEYLGDILY